MWALATRGMHTAGQQTARALASLLSRFKRDRTALRHRFKRCASQVVSQCWALNREAWAARATSLPPAQKSAKEQPDGFHQRGRSFPRWRQPLKPTRSPIRAASGVFGAQEVSRRCVWHFCHSLQKRSLFQVPVRIIVLFAESRASKLGDDFRSAYSAPVTRSRQQMAALQPNTEMLRRQLGPSRREGGPGILVHTSTVRFRRTAKRTVRTHSGPAWYPSAPVSCLFVWTSSENSFSRD